MAREFVVIRCYTQTFVVSLSEKRNVDAPRRGAPKLAKIRKGSSKPQNLENYKMRKIPNYGEKPNYGKCKCKKCKLWKLQNYEK